MIDDVLGWDWTDVLLDVINLSLSKSNDFVDVSPLIVNATDGVVTSVSLLWAVPVVFWEFLNVLVSRASSSFKLSST